MIDATTRLFKRWYRPSDELRRNYEQTMRNHKRILAWLEKSEKREQEKWQTK